MDRRTLVLTRWHPTPPRPDWAPFLTEWTEIAARLGDVVVLHLDDTALLGVEEDHTATTTIVRVGLRGAGAHRPVGHLRDWADARRAIREAVAKYDITLIHAHAYPAAVPLFGWRGRPAVVLTEHFTRLLRDDFGLPQRLEARAAYRAADALTAVGPALVEAVDSLIGIRPVLIPNPVASGVGPAPMPAVAEPYRLVAAGRLEPIKGFDVLLEALRLLTHDGIRVQVTIFGEGSRRLELEQTIAAQELRGVVELPGAVPREHVWEAMRAAHLIVVPSRHETFSLVAAEALAIGRPVVATRSGGPEAYLGDQPLSRLVAPGDASALASAIAEVVADLGAVDADDISDRVTSRFSVDAVAEQVEPVYAAAEAMAHRRRSA